MFPEIANIQRGGLSSPEGHPGASPVFIGSLGTSLVEMRSQLVHSKVRRSYPGGAGEMLSSVMRAWQCGQRGRSKRLGGVVGNECEMGI
jgi:hypothetical protein